MNLRLVNYMIAKPVTKGPEVRLPGLYKFPNEENLVSTHLKSSLEISSCLLQFLKEKEERTGMITEPASRSTEVSMPRFFY